MNSGQHDLTNNPLNRAQKHRRTIAKSVIDSLVSGSISSTVVTVLYQPLELLKTRIQLNDTPGQNGTKSRGVFKIFGRATRSAIALSRTNGFTYLWRGTGPSLLRSTPGVGLYYATLKLLQSNFSENNSKPDNPRQAFYFGLASRSLVSFILLPITVVKVRLESGRFNYPSLVSALKSAYLSNGWVGVVPTVLRDSLFSGTYYMCYTSLKAHNQKLPDDRALSHQLNFMNGILSGLVASIVTNPLDVLKTNIQVTDVGQLRGNVSMKQVAIDLVRGTNGRVSFVRLFDGLVPRCVRRTLTAATTWTLYEFMIETLN